MLGDLLREKREQLNLSLDDIEKGTNIRKLYIKSIEEGNYDKLPGEVFLKGFIKTYGKFLGLDSQQLLEQYKNEKNATKVATETPKSDKETVQPIQEVPEKDNESQQIVKEKNKKRENIPKINSLEDNQAYLQPHKTNSKKNILLVVIILIIIIGGAIFLLSNQSSTETPAPTTTQQQETTSTPASEPPAPTPVAITDAEVKAEFTADCWTEVKVDGKTVLSETVKKGSTLEWKGNKQIDITVGNAGAINITFNNQPVGNLGSIGAVVSKTFVAPNQNTTNSTPNETTPAK